LPAPGDVSTDAAVVVTNIVLAGITIWVLFSSVFLNQVLQDHRSEVDAATTRFSRPFRRLVAGNGKSRSAVTAGWVLLITALIYGFLDPGFGINKASALLVVAIIAGVGLVTYVCSGTEATATRRFAGAAASVRPFPATIAVAIASVALSRAVDLQPGVIYGFVASVAVAGAVEIDVRRQGRVTLMAVTAGLALTLACWVAVGALRSANEEGDNALPALIETICVTVFVGGVEGLFFNMIPLSVMEGGKLFRWNKPVWALFAVASAFLFWHVLLNQQRSNFAALREASSATVLVVFLMYSGASVGLWWWFKRRDARKAA
jgi:hypothetical protein